MYGGKCKIRHIIEFDCFHSSFSILLWEIATYGASPYPKIELCQVFDHLRVSIIQNPFIQIIAFLFNRMEIEWNVQLVVQLMYIISCKNVCRFKTNISNTISRLSPYEGLIDRRLYYEQNT
jgi:hypothetical protein